ncbi:MAG: hypothetical protein D8M58_18640 [Calditrichaeota bacterium]|nr:MAG: hypothetical protein DWQ03_21320 [Calditrichota bacterium]MBL1207428.1 hypothetical protein [Calditrichota bacterium]NOG47260.1 hypothetical protein [Calditrichota bacterium]
MNTFFNITLITLLSLSQLFARSFNDPQIMEAESIKTVYIKLNGVIIIENSLDNKVHIKTTSKVDGKIIGFSNNEDLSAYRVETFMDEKDLTIKPAKRESRWTVGINTVSEENTHIIRIPKDKNVVINSSDANININGRYALLKINNREGETEITALENDIRYLTCRSANGEIWFNGKEQEESYMNILPGNAVIDVNSYRGIIKMYVK